VTLDNLQEMSLEAYPCIRLLRNKHNNHQLQIQCPFLLENY